MMLVVTGVGFLIHLYSIGYMHGDPGVARYFSYLNLFIFSMLMLVMVITCCCSTGLGRCWAVLLPAHRILV